MEQQDTAPSTEQTPTSLGTRIMNVFSAPSELCTEVAAMPVQRSSWLVPYVLSMILVLFFTYALYNNESLRHQIMDMQMETMRQSVAEGNMSQAQFDAAEEQMQNVGLVSFMLLGGVSQVVFLTLMFFGLALVLWLAGKFALKSPAGYMKYLEITGLVSMVGWVGAIITLLLMYAFDSMHATPSAALAVIGSYDVKNTMHKILSSANVFSIWETAVIGIAFSKVSGKSMGMGMGVAFGLWIVWVAISVGLNLGFR